MLRVGFAASFSFADMYMQAWAQLRLDGSLIPHLTQLSLIPHQNYLRQIQLNLIPRLTQHQNQLGLTQ